MERTASCVCGQLSVTVTGEPERVNMCHCVDCQRRSGSAFQIGALFAEAQVVAITGEAKVYKRPAPAGRTVDLYFCPECGVSVYFRFPALRADAIGIHGGCFADPGFPAPTHAIFTRGRHTWVGLPEGAKVHV